MDLHVEGTRTLKEGLQPKIDFRAISPTMWYIFVELYNRDGAPEICRYSLNIYDPGVAGRYRERASRGAALKARVEVSKLRESFLPETSSEEEVRPSVCPSVRPSVRPDDGANRLITHKHPSAPAPQSTLFSFAPSHARRRRATTRTHAPRTHDELCGQWDNKVSSEMEKRSNTMHRTHPLIDPF